MILPQLFFEFFKTGLFSFGGGLAALPFLQEISEKTGWFTAAQLADMIAVSESTPGPIGINMATYVGYATAGVLGAITATVGYIMPSSAIAFIAARLLGKFMDNKFVQSAFTGLRPASLALIAVAGLSVLQISLLRTELWQETKILGSLFDIKAIILAALLFAATKIWDAHPMVFLAISAAAGIILKF